MMKPELKAKLEKLTPVTTIEPVTSGEPATIVIRPAGKSAEVNTITAAEALAKRGLTLLKSKRTIEAMMERGEAVVDVPMGEDATKFARELKKSGVDARRIAHSAVDVKAVREALGMAQGEFALRFGLDIDAVQNWEQGRRRMDRSTLALMRVIAVAPKVVAVALEEKLA